MKFFQIHYTILELKYQLCAFFGFVCLFFSCIQHQYFTLVTALIGCEQYGRTGPPEIDQRVGPPYTRNCSIFSKEH